MFLILFLLLPQFAFSEVWDTKLPILATKQSVNNLRFASQDGKFTYYQRRSGALLFSTNYKVEEVIKGPPGTYYHLFSTSARKRVAIVKNESFYNYSALFSLKEIFVVDWSDHKAKFVGLGVNPKLHLKDDWMSYYHPQKKTIFFTNLENEAIKFQIKLKSKLNPYYVPEVEMLNDEEVLYTDMNNDGITAIFMSNRRSKKVQKIDVTSSNQEKLEFCSRNNKLFIGRFGHNKSKVGSVITSYEKNNFRLDKGEILYESTKNEPGNIVCDVRDGKVYFIQNLSEEDTLTRSEAAEIDLKSKKVKTISDLAYVGQMLNIDGRLLVPFRGEYFILVGENNLKDDALPEDAESSEGKEKKAPAKTKKKKKSSSKKNSKSKKGGLGGVDLKTDSKKRKVNRRRGGR